MKIIKLAWRFRRDLTVWTSTSALGNPSASIREDFSPTPRSSSCPFQKEEGFFRLWSRLKTLPTCLLICTISASIESFWLIKRRISGFIFLFLWRYTRPGVETPAKKSWTREFRELREKFSPGNYWSSWPIFPSTDFAQTSPLCASSHAASFGTIFKLVRNRVQISYFFSKKRISWFQSCYVTGSHEGI